MLISRQKVFLCMALVIVGICELFKVTVSSHVLNCTFNINCSPLKTLENNYWSQWDDILLEGIFKRGRHTAEFSLVVCMFMAGGPSILVFHTKGLPDKPKQLWQPLFTSKQILPESSFIINSPIHFLFSPIICHFALCCQLCQTTLWLRVTVLLRWLDFFCLCLLCVCSLSIWFLQLFLWVFSLCAPHFLNSLSRSISLIFSFPSLPPKVAKISM